MIDRKPRRLDTEALWAYALKALSGRAHSIGEMREKLRSRAERESDIPMLLERLKDCGYLDDSKFAESYAAARLSGNGLGRIRVLQDLRQRRVAPGLAQETVERVYRDTDEETLVEEWVRRKYRMAARDALFQTDRDMAAAYRRLLRAGFAAGPIVRVLKRFAKNPDLVDVMEPPPEPDEDTNRQ
jgi:regulatory protein